MRMALAVIMALGALACPAQAAAGLERVKRYGVELDLDKYPQATPKDALASVLKAIEYRKIDYLLAHLADPKYVDHRVQQVHGGKFEGMVEEVTDKLSNDPGAVKKLHQFLDEGTWETQENTASVKFKEGTERVYLRKIDNRWFFENQGRAKAEAKEAGAKEK